MTGDRRNPCLYGCWVLLGALCCIFGGLAWVFESSDMVISTPIKEWRAKRWLNSTYEDVLKITDDVELVEIEEPEITVGGTMRCVSAEAIQVLGTDRTYDEVVEDYISWSREKGWKVREIPDNAEVSRAREFYTPDDIYSDFFNISRSFIIRPHQLEEPVDFETVYTIELFFIERRCEP